jgi:Mg/Co/Ni transporter MgtE
LVLTFIQQHPEAAARELELQPQDIAAELVAQLPLKQGRQLIGHMLPPYVARLSTHWSLDTVAALLSDFSANKISSILRCIPNPRRDELVKVLPEKTAAICRLLMSYSEDTVGAWMRADMLMLPSNCRVDEALKRFSSASDNAVGGRLLVVDELQHLVGLISLQTLMQSKANASITHLMKPVPPVLHARTSLVAAHKHEGWHSYDTLAVLNRNQQLVGVLCHVDLRKSLAHVGESPSVAASGQLISSMTEAYTGTMMALIRLVGWTSSRVTSREE